MLTYKQHNQKSYWLLNEPDPKSSLSYSIQKGKICKKFFDKASFDIELYNIILLKSKKIGILPEIIHIENNLIEYNYNNIKILKDVLNDKNTNFHLLINELLSFFKYLQTKKIIIGNVNINNIYVNITFDTFKIFIIDITCVKFNQLLNNTDLDALYINLLKNNIPRQVMDYLDNQLNFN